MLKDQHFINKITTGISKGYNIKGISSCFYCQENNITYDDIRDEIYCFVCGTVLRQGLIDYQPYPVVDYNYDLSYCDDLLDWESEQLRILEQLKK
jgi:ribosomal protein S27E